MLHRVPLRTATDLDELAALVAGEPDDVVLVFDADNTLVPQGVDLETFRRGVGTAIERFTALQNVARVIVLSNGPERGVPSMIHRGNKPWTTRRRLDEDPGSSRIQAARVKVWSPSSAASLDTRMTCSSAPLR